jgi:hypothetical protein
MFGFDRLADGTVRVAQRALSSTRGSSGRPDSDPLVTRCAVARLWACCSSRSMPKSSARIGSRACRAGTIAEDS